VFTLDDREVARVSFPVTVQGDGSR
jgi:hypothetical protein